MAAGFKVRLVRCPKCENVLPELPDYSVYQCGGCAAILRAKKEVIGNRRQLEKVIKERDEEGFERLQSLSEKVGGGLGNASKAERESDGIINGRERFFGEKTVDLVTSPVPRNENKLDSSTDISSRNVKEQNIGYQSDAGKGQPLKHPIDMEVRRNDKEKMNNMAESVSSSIPEISAKFRNSAGSLRSRVTVDQLDRDGFRKGNRRIADKLQNAYPDEGPSNYHLGSSSYGNDKLVNNCNNLDGPNRIAYLEQDRAELLRKLDELKEQLTGSSVGGEKQKVRPPVDSRKVPPDPYRRHVAYNVSKQQLTPDKHVINPSYFKQYGHEPVQYANSHDKEMPNFYNLPKRAPNEIPVYQDQFRPQNPRVQHNQPRQQHWHQQTNDYFSGKYKGFGQEPPACYPKETSCLHCYNEKWHVPSQFPHTVFGNRNFPKASKDLNMNLHVNAVAFGLKSFNPQANSWAAHLRNPPHARWPSDIDSDIEAFRHHRPRRVVAAHKKGWPCHPLAGGAPFISCYNCFELLKLPGKFKLTEKNQQKLRCGACSTVLLFRIENKRLNISVVAEKKQILAANDGGSCELSKEVLSSVVNVGGRECYADFDNIDFQSVDFKDKVPSEEARQNVAKSSERQGLASSSSISSEEEESLDNKIVRRDVSSSAELTAKHDASPALQSSPVKEHFDVVTFSHQVSSCGDGNNTKWTDKENSVLDKSTSLHSSVNDAFTGTEMEVSLNEYLNTSLSQDSVEPTEEDTSRSRINKGSEPFLVGLVKKTFRDLSRSNQDIGIDKPSVSVNGKQIPDRMVKKAEKLAGPIQPGDYWYDSRAGFWGVMGQPCLGIIPPFIEEFNYPMPENCSAGDTGVFVNGRELHEEDLEVLASRGLPTTREKFYVIELSGKVCDEDTGEVLNVLGKLAPTIEKVKRGFGMRVPRKLM